jgi:hypothetical protein
LIADCVESFIWRIQVPWDNPKQLFIAKQGEV